MAKAKKKVTKKKVARKVGRPTDYKKEYCKELHDFFIKRFNVVMKGLDTDKKSDKIFPTFQEWYLIENDFAPNTFHEWLKVHEEFKETYYKCKHLQEMVLTWGGALGIYKANMIQLLLQHSHGYKDHKEIDLRYSQKKDINDMTDDELREAIERELSR